MFQAMKNLCTTCQCDENDAWWCLKESNWSSQGAFVKLDALREFCSMSSCRRPDAWRYLKHADWNVNRAVLEFHKKDQVYFIACPYKQHGDCDRVWPIAHSDLNCRRARCGTNIWRGKEYQFPKHGMRYKIEAHLQSWPGDEWEGWPG